MPKQNSRTLQIAVIILLGILLMGQDCPAQTGLCDSDPCQGIPNAIAGTCTEVGGSCTGPSDFICSCVAGSTWQDAANTCKGPMTPIPEGCFDMGDAFSEGDTDELPPHQVCITAFEMDVHQVTNAEYAECVAAAACTAPFRSDSISHTTYYGNPMYEDFPVIWVDWYQAEDYCAWAGKRLPTEAEWEYAARGGLAEKRYPWGDTIAGSDANYWNSGDPWDNDTSQVEYYAPNGYGLYDMAGNVWELVNDWYGDDYYQYCLDHGIVDDPPGPASGTSRVWRGGAWTSAADQRLVSNRAGGGPTHVHDEIGFRCARGGAYGP